MLLKLGVIYKVFKIKVSSKTIITIRAALFIKFKWIDFFYVYGKPSAFNGVLLFNEPVWLQEPSPPFFLDRSLCCSQFVAIQYLPSLATKLVQISVVCFLFAFSFCLQTQICYTFRASAVTRKHSLSNLLSKSSRSPQRLQSASKGAPSFVCSGACGCANWFPSGWMVEYDTFLL